MSRTSTIELAKEVTRLLQQEREPQAVPVPPVPPAFVERDLGAGCRLRRRKKETTTP